MVTGIEEPAETAARQVSLCARYQQVRDFSRRIAEPLEVEDQVIQSMPDASPISWHLAHTTWFFETLVLDHCSGYSTLNPAFRYLFNSYYNALGPQFPRPQRGLLSRPTVRQVQAYRDHVDRHMLDLLDRGRLPPEQEPVVEIGLHHEQQHQELMLTDLKHLFWCNPLRPVYRETNPSLFSLGRVETSWITCPGGTCRIGHEGEGFAYDNELPRHAILVEPYLLAGGLVTNGEYLEFMQDHAYERPELWLSDGWRTVQERQWRCPLYWEEADGRWRYMTLSGMQDLDPARPLCHVSYYEADAFARWAGARLARESEWEIIAETVPITGNFVESGHLHPAPFQDEEPRATPWQMFGDVWEWTASPYAPYPGYRQAPGPLGEYNGKFMCNQLVLRGGSCATPVTHIRPTYRNFFPPEARWQFSGIRLAKDA